MTIRITSLETFKQAAKQVHGEKYDYSKSVYNGSRKAKTEIRCNAHKVTFEMTPNNHVAGKQGCAICRMAKRLKDFKNAYVYVVKLNVDNETFYKVGVSSNLDRRLIQLKKFDPVVISSDLYPTDIACMLEYSYQQLLHSDGAHAVPSVKFDGSVSECFSNIDAIKNIIKIGEWLK